MGANLNYSFWNLENTQLIELTEIVIQKMKHNEHIKSPQPSVEEIRDALKCFQQVLFTEFSTIHLQYIEHESARKTLEAKLIKLAKYIMFIYHGNQKVLETTGFTIAGDSLNSSDYTKFNRATAV